MPFPTLCWLFILLSFSWDLPYKGKNWLLKSLPVKCFNRCCQDLFCSVFPLSCEICLPCPWLVNTIVTLAHFLLEYKPQFICREVSRPLVLFGIHCHARLQYLMHRMEERWTGLIWTYSNECVFEALHVANFVMAPPGPAVDGLSGFLTRGVMACALGLVHNHLLCLSDHAPLLLCLFLYIWPWSSLEDFERQTQKQDGMDQVWVQGHHRASAEWQLPITHNDCYNRVRQSLLITFTVGAGILILLLDDALQEERIRMINHNGTSWVMWVSVAYS